MRNNNNNNIPKIIHQLWIGQKSPPLKMMATWKNKHPDYQYIYWTDALLLDEKIHHMMPLLAEYQPIIDLMAEINGKADIIRWIILYYYGGVFIDADSICIEPLDDYIFLRGHSGFATFENENIRAGLIATGTMGFIKQHPLCYDILQWLKTDDAHNMIIGFRAWYSVGPALLTRMLDSGKYGGCFTVFPSYFFLPTHFTGLQYDGHRKVYGYQEWGTAKESYDTMNTIELPDIYIITNIWVSILISSYNVTPKYITECLESIKEQRGHFGMELVWINDGSSGDYTADLIGQLEEFIKTTRFTKLIYKEMKQNWGTRFCLNQGVLLCSNELIIKMDADDIMLPLRIQTQIDFMNERPDCVLCGTDAILFRTDNGGKKKIIMGRTKHQEVILWEDFLQTQTQSGWILNHPSLCYRKSALLEAGNYSQQHNNNALEHNKSMMEDYEMELAMLKKWGKLYNIPKILIYYRIHEGQLTQRYKAEMPEMMALKNQILLEKC